MKISEVKKFDERYFNAMRQLLLQLVSEEQLPSKEHFVRLIESQNSQLFIAQLEGTELNELKNAQLEGTSIKNSQIVGTMTIATYEIPSGKRMWIEDVVVDTTHRGKGIGQQLIQYAIEHCKAMGGTDIRLTSRPARVAANLLYQKVGFNQVETNVYLLKLPT